MAIHNVLFPIYLQIPKSEEEWTAIADGYFRAGTCRIQLVYFQYKYKNVQFYRSNRRKTLRGEMSK